MLIVPRLQAPCQRAVLRSGKNRDLANAVRLGFVLARRGFIRGQLTLNLGAVIARYALKIQLCIGKFVGIKPELRFGNFKIVTAGNGLRAILRRTGRGT